VFEGGGVKGIAFAGAVAAAEKDAGVREWVNLAGTSAGAICAALLVVGYDAAGLQRILDQAEYPKFADYGFGGMWLGGVFNGIFRMRGLAAGKYFEEWLSEQIAASPHAKALGKTELTFGDIKRLDLPPRAEVPEVSDATYARAIYRLHVIGSDVTSGQMVILPDDLPNYTDPQGAALEKDSFPLVQAVRMSMSFPFLFKPVALHKGNKPYWVVDGGLLSNFPIWLFDAPNPKRPTWGFRLHGGTSPTESLPYRKVPRPFWEMPLLKAMFQSATEAWDRQELQGAVDTRTVSIPTHNISTTDFGLSKTDAANLYTWGNEAGDQFFNDPQQQAYIQRFRQNAPLVTY
jgi:NTE family protein